MGEELKAVTVSLTIDNWNIVIAGLNNVAYGYAAPIIADIHNAINTSNKAEEPEISLSTDKKE